MLDESEALRQQGAELGFGRDRSDKLFSCFQALDPYSSGAAGSTSVRREMLQHKLAGGAGQFVSKTQLVEVLRQLSEEPVQVEFAAFLRIMKTLEGQVEGDFDECIDNILKFQWHAGYSQPELLDAFMENVEGCSGSVP